MSKIVDANKKIADAVVGGYQKIEDTVVGSYKKIEDGVTQGYEKIENKFVDTFLRKDDETIEEAKGRLHKEQEERQKKEKDVK